MLNIPSKQEVKQVVEENKNRLIRIKKEIIEKNLQRDAEIIKSEVIPQLKNTIALGHYFKNIEFFQFKLPIMTFEGYELPQEEKNEILHAYYHEKVWLKLDDGIRAEESNASRVGSVFEGVFGWYFVFKQCDVHEDTNTVHFKLRLTQDIEKINVKEELKAIAEKIDKYVEPHFNFETVAKEIRDCYNLLQVNRVIAVYDKDLEVYPVATLNIEDILKESDFYSEIELPDENLKIDIWSYIPNSKLIKSVKRKLKNYGYEMVVEPNHSDRVGFRYIGIYVTVNATLPSKEMKAKQLLKSETLREAFDKKKQEYNEVLKSKMEKENTRLISLVESGHFDAYIAEKWVKATLMNVGKLTHPYFVGERTSNDISFSFSVAFDRQTEELEFFERKIHVFDGLGIRYLEMENNILDALKKRYPFFAHAKVIGDNFYDFQYRTGAWGTDDFYIKENSLSFGFEMNQKDYASQKQEIFEWIASSYGALNIETLLEEIQFHPKGITEKVETYFKHHMTNETPAKNKVHIVLGEFHEKDLYEVYQNHSLYEKTVDLFEDEHENEHWGYRELTTEYKTLKVKEFQTLKLGNLFVHALFVHPMFKEIQKELQQKGYELKVEYVKRNEREMESGNRAITGDKMMKDVCEYSVKLVIE